MNKRVIGVIFGLVILTLAAFKLPTYDPDEDGQMLLRYNQMFASLGSMPNTIHEFGSESTSIPFPIMTFNIRLDALEEDPNNHFIKRLPRLANVFNKWKPLAAGLQEPFNGQIMDLSRTLGSKYRFVGFKRPGFSHEYASMGHPSRKNDYQTALLYDSESLELVFEDHVWLSDSPRVIGSKFPQSQGIRTLTFARFKIRPEYLKSNGLPDSEATHVLVFNTHLDRWQEEGRRYQARKVLEWIERTKATYPNDAVFLLGDFNSVPGHQSHRILTSKLNDTWDTCKRMNGTNCVSNSYAASYNHWWGPFVNTYAARFVQYFLHTFHGGGVLVVSSHMGIRQVLSALSNITISGLLEGLPASLNRLHVDWILFGQPEAAKLGANNHDNSAPMTVIPRFVSVVDTVATNLSSDHYPVMALFELKRTYKTKKE